MIFTLEIDLVGNICMDTFNTFKECADEIYRRHNCEYGIYEFNEFALDHGTDESKLNQSYHLPLYKKLFPCCFSGFFSTYSA